MASRGSVSSCIEHLKSGDEEAARELWDRYFARLVRLAGAKLRNNPRRVADEEDLALSVLDALCRGARQGRFPILSNRDDLWRLLLTLTARKASNRVAYHNRQKRGGGKVRGESGFVGQGSAKDEDGIHQVLSRDPGPSTLEELEEGYQNLLQSLGDDRLRQIAVWSMEGYSNQEIARMLGCALRTVARKLELIRTIWCTRRN